MEGHLPQILLPKSIPFFDQFPAGHHPYILDVVDVKADGHCGYRAVVAKLGMGEESWAVVRMNLLKELSEWRQEYVELFDGDERYEYLKKSLLVDHMSMVRMAKTLSFVLCISPFNFVPQLNLQVGTDKWMTIPDMGYVITNQYNAILVSLSMIQSLTIFPLRTQPPSNFTQHRIITIEHVHGNQFVQVYPKYIKM